MAQSARTQRIQEMQDLLIHHAGSAFYALGDEGVPADDPRVKELDRQFSRIERLFGYAPGTFRRG